MIRCLNVSNLAIIRQATLDLGPGLNLLTGETGAGKSILVDALTVVLGGRAGADLIRTGAPRASVEAVIDVSGNASAAAFLESHGYSLEEGAVLVRREIAGQGRGRAFIGGVLAPVGDLRALGALIVDVHGQHQHQTLLNPSGHRDLLDRRAGLREDLRAMDAAARELDAAGARLVSMREGAQRVAQRIDVLRFQLQEIDRAGVRSGERASLRAERELLRNAESILGHCRRAYEALYEGESAALAGIAEGLRETRELARFDAGLADLVERAESARAEIHELALLLRDYPSRLSFDPNRLEAIEERLVLLDGLLRKYAPGGDEDAILAFRRRSEEELSQLTDGSESVTDLAARVEKLRAAALGLAATLSRKRRAAALVLERLVEGILQDLAMGRTRFAVDFRLRPCPGSGLCVKGEEVAVDGAGYDVVEFLLSANQGEALRPLAGVASGGELSRIMLALEVALRRDAEVRTLVFDEVDAGIGGAVAEAVGRMLRRLARRHQVVCVTHLPQIASHADHHVVVAKRAARGRTEVTLEALDADGKVRELARMLAGETVTASALRHAEELLARGAAS
ncbi:MAG: DNA repair protein RecN [Acidobacteriota bacterium]